MRFARGVAEIPKDARFLVWWGYPAVFFTTQEDAERFVARSERYDRPEEGATDEALHSLHRTAKGEKVKGYPGVLYPEAVAAEAARRGAQR